MPSATDSVDAARISQGGPLVTLDVICSFVDELEDELNVVGLGTQLADDPYVVTKDGEIKTSKEHPTLIAAKQLELYSRIKQRVKHNPTLKALKADAIAKKVNKGKLAFDHLKELRTRSETDVVKSIRAKIRKLCAAGLRSPSEAPLDEFIKELDELIEQMPESKKMTGEEYASAIAEALPESFSKDVATLGVVHGVKMDDPAESVPLLRALVRSNENAAERDAERAKAAALAALADKLGDRDPSEAAAREDSEAPLSLAGRDARA